MRGAVRLALGHLEVASGRDGQILPDPAAVKRLVFLCHGNICRSAVADVVARAEGMASASFGLSTSTGRVAHGPMVQAALAQGIGMADHRTTAVEDFEARPGDLLLAMETRHLRKLAAHPVLKNYPRILLGGRSFPHLHDPFELDPAFMATTVRRIAAAVRALPARYPGARRGG